MKIGDSSTGMIKAFGDGLPKVADIEVNKGAEGQGGFSNAVGSALEAIENHAKSADQASNKFLEGEIGLHEAMVRMEKANLMLKMGSTVRSKMLEAYQKLLSSAG